MADKTNNGRLISKREVAARLALTPETVARMARRGELPAHRVAGRYRFSAAEIERWLEQQRVRKAEVPE